MTNIKVTLLIMPLINQEKDSLRLNLFSRSVLARYKHIATIYITKPVYNQLK